MDELEHRRRMFWEFYDFGTGRGLEIGPLHRPIVLRDRAEVAYVDVWDQAGVRAHYADKPTVIAADIPEIDYFLTKSDGSMVTLPEAAGAGAPFDWVFASHVIEHVPDVITWLEHIAELVADDGALVLAVPDKRFCFDAHRPVTTVGQLLAAREAGDTVPSPRAVFDYFSSFVEVDSAPLWRGESPPRRTDLAALELAVTMAESARAGEYVDCHAWLFTPDTFLDQLRDLRRLGVSSWYVEQQRSTLPNDLEFLVRLRRIPRGVDVRVDPPGELAPALRADWTEEELLGRRAGELGLEERVPELEAQVARRGVRIRKLVRKNKRLRKRVARLQARGRSAAPPPGKLRSRLGAARRRLRG
jgi:SAM-dependent methyltransferase